MTQHIRTGLLTGLLTLISAIPVMSQYDFTISSTSGCTPMMVKYQFTRTASVDTISSYYWDFGNGQTSTLGNPDSVTYDAAGTYSPSLIFNNRDLLEKVNSLIHPVVSRNFKRWATEQNSPYSIMEAAILFESGAYRIMDKILTVVTPMEERIDRLVKGNKLTREQVMERIRNQIDDESRIKQSDYLIFNSENDMIIPAILGVHEEMLNLFNKEK